MEYNFLVILVWTVAFTTAFFYILKACNLHRISFEEEIEGMDMSHCGGMAHNYDEVSLKFYAHQFREILKEDAAQELLIRKITGESQSKAKNLEESPVKIESQIWKALKALLIE